MNIYERLQAMKVLSTRAKNRHLLQPAIVEAALARLEHPLSLDEQIVVLRAVGDRKKVKWPDWWEAC